MITIDDIKNEYLIKNLSKMKNYDFHIVTDTGEYRSPERKGNAVKTYVNGVFSLQGVDFQQLNDGRIAAGFEFLLKFILPLDDHIPFTLGGTKEYQTLISFREELSQTLAGATLVTIEKTEKDENDQEVTRTYTGGAMFNLPMPNENAIRQSVGKSIVYSCTIAIGLLEGGVNTSKMSLTIDGDKVAFTGIKMSRTPTLSADLLASTKNDESTVYAESTQFKIEFTVPALDGVVYSTAIMEYVLGLTDGNMPHKVLVETPIASWKEEKLMIFGGCETQGNGVSNLLYGVSLVPYTAQEIVQG